MIFGLFLNICMLGSMCEYVPQGYTYPDEARCTEDMRQEELPSPQYACLPIESVERPAGFHHAG